MDGSNVVPSPAKFDMTATRKLMEDLNVSRGKHVANKSRRTSRTIQMVRTDPSTTTRKLVEELNVSGSPHVANNSRRTNRARVDRMSDGRRMS